jgi:hypothetical protein
MKKLAIILTLLFSVSLAFDASAQLSKQERKGLKKQAKGLAKNPEDLKELLDENNSLKGQVRSLNSQVTDLQGAMGGKDAKISELQNQISEMRAQVAASQKEVSDMRKAMGEKKAAPALDDSGVWFKVQVGAFKNIDMAEYFKNNDNFSGETGEDGLQRITLGRFRDYWEADKFKKALRDMGVRQAWIVPYKDGARVPLRDVLEGVTE